MKCFIAVAMLALFAMAFAEERPLEPENLGPVPVAPHDAPRDKRGVLLSYSSPIAYTAPIGYPSYNPPILRTYPSLLYKSASHWV